MGDFVGIAIALAIVALVVILWRRRQSPLSEADLRQRLVELDERRQELAGELLQVAAASGKPRGLRWVSCELSGESVFAVDPKSRQLYALVAVTISFEAIEGGGMEEVEAVGNLRSATAVFLQRGGRWTTDGRVIFNLEPVEALERFGSTLEPVTSS